MSVPKFYSITTTTTGEVKHGSNLNSSWSMDKSITEEGEDSIAEVSDYEEDDSSVVMSISDGEGIDSEDENSAEESCGFFSDEDHTGGGSPDDAFWITEEDRTSRRSTNDSVSSVRSVVLRGKCSLCANLEEVPTTELEVRCQISSADSWCKCGGRCKIVSYHMTKFDRVCCRELSAVLGFMESGRKNIGCITLHPDFEECVLHYGAMYRSSSGGDGDATSESFNHTSKSKLKDEKERAHGALLAFIRWIWSNLTSGHNNRHLSPPACVITRIREEHMKSAPFWYYPNFLSPKIQCEFGKHCVPST